MSYPQTHRVPRFATIHSEMFPLPAQSYINAQFGPSPAISDGFAMSGMGFGDNMQCSCMMSGSRRGRPTGRQAELRRARINAGTVQLAGDFQRKLRENMMLPRSHKRRGSTASFAKEYARWCARQGDVPYSYPALAAVMRSIANLELSRNQNAGLADRNLSVIDQNELEEILRERAPSQMAGKKKRRKRRGSRRARRQAAGGGVFQNVGGAIADAARSGGTGALDSLLQRFTGGGGGGGGEGAPVAYVETSVPSRGVGAGTILAGLAAAAAVAFAVTR